jgi:hypothetical protein
MFVFYELIVQCWVEFVIENSILVFFVPFVSVTYTAMVAMCAVVLHECIRQLVSYMSNWVYAFLLFPWRIFLDKEMDSVVKRKLSLLIFMWYYVRIFSDVTWRINLTLPNPTKLTLEKWIHGIKVRVFSIYATLIS